MWLTVIFKCYILTGYINKLFPGIHLITPSPASGGDRSSVSKTAGLLKLVHNIDRGYRHLLQYVLGFAASSIAGGATICHDMLEFYWLQKNETEETVYLSVKYNPPINWHEFIWAFPFENSSKLKVFSRCSTFVMIYNIEYALFSLMYQEDELQLFFI